MLSLWIEQWRQNAGDNLDGVCAKKKAHTASKEDSGRGGIARAHGARAGGKNVNVREVSSSSPPGDVVTTSDCEGADVFPPSPRISVVMQQRQQAARQGYLSDESYRALNCTCGANDGQGAR